MLRLAITGGLCSGKSAVAKMLRELGCPVLDADAVGRELLLGKQAAAVEARFGHGIVDSEGRICPAKLARRVFAPGAEKELAALEGILHPAILEEAAAWFGEQERAGAAGAGLEATLLIEKRLLEGFDRVLLVVAEEEERIRRFIGRAGGTRAEALARMAYQLPDAEKRQHADAVIDNNGTMEGTLRQVEAVWARWRSEAGA